MTKLCWFHEVSWRLKLEHVNFRVTFKKGGVGGDAASHGLNEVTGHHHSHVWLQGGWIYQVSRSPKSNTTPPFTIIICSCITQAHITGSHNTRKRKKRTKKKVTMLRFLPSSYNLKSQLDKDWRRPWWEVEEELIVPPRTHPGPWWGSTGRISLETWGSSGKCWPFSSPHQVRSPSLSTFSIGQGGGVF